MANVTITMDKEMLEKAKDLAAVNRMSLSAMVRRNLEREVGKDDTLAREWWGNFEAMTERLGGNSQGWKWNREELYEGRW